MYIYVGCGDRGLGRYRVRGRDMLSHYTSTPSRDCMHARSHILTHTHTNIPFRQYDCHRSVRSGTEPLCVCIQLQGPYDSHLLSLGTSYSENTCIWLSVAERTCSSHTNCEHRKLSPPAMYRNFCSVVKGTQTSVCKIKEQNRFRKL